MIDAIQKKRAVEAKLEAEHELFKEMLPALRQLIKAGGTADTILKKSGPFAALKIIKLMNSEKEEVALKASEKVLSYDLGKPVERSINVYGDISRMNERDVDQQIMQLLNKTGAAKLIETTLEIKVPKKKRKPRKSQPLVIDQEPFTSAEAGTTAAAEEQGTT